MPDTFRRKVALFLAAGIVLTLAGALVSLTIGRFGASVGDVMRAVASLVTENAAGDRIAGLVLEIRLPRILLALLAGAGLAMAGAAFQSIFVNPLATPDTLGVASGAAFGAVVAILLGMPALAVQFCALVCGLLAVAVVWAVSYSRGRTSMLMLILSGLVVAALFSALISLVKYLADPQDTLPTITFWMMGSMTGASMKSLALSSPFVLVGCAALYLLRWKLNALSLSNEEASSLGIRVKWLRAAVITAATMISAAVVSMCGLIGWVGLLVPHFVRLVVGNNNMYVMPASLIYGALFMLFCDTTARSACSLEIPVSILTAVIGAPVFLILLHRSRLTRRL